jgi:YD repeat-containing protein
VCRPAPVPARVSRQQGEHRRRGPVRGSPTPIVYWFAGEADPDCRPWLDAECGQIGICGSALKISADFIETFLQLGSASCVDPVPTHTGELSILAASCPSRFSCPKRTFDSSTVTPTAVKKGLGCVDPPKQECDDCMACALPGCRPLTTDPRGRRQPADLVTAHEYDTFGELLRTTLPESNVIGYGYDAVGRFTSSERKQDASSPPNGSGEPAWTAPATARASAILEA